MSLVSLQKCRSYDPAVLQDVISKGLVQAGFDLADFFGKTVVVKPNLLTPAGPHRAVVTHPDFFRAASKVAIDHGARVIVAENPAVTGLERTMKISGYDAAVKDLGLEVADMAKTRVLFCSNSQRFSRFEISEVFFDADIVMSLPKLKTHGITYVTGAAKNLFGTIYGLNKSRWHMKASTKEEFSDFLLDLNQALVDGFEKPRTYLHVMDAVLAMEGEGPGPSGTPREVGAVIVGKNPTAVDWVATSVLGFPANKVRTVTGGFARNMGVSSPEEIQVKGETIANLAMSDFAPSKGTFMSNMWRGPLATKTVRNLFTERPVPQEEKCTLCYQCMKICPAKAISKAANGQKTPEYDYKKCIRCYCCAEICPEAAIDLKKGRFQWVLRV